MGSTKDLLNGFSIDIEANGLIFEASKIWTICIEDLDTEDKLRINPFKDKNAKKKLIDWIEKYDNPTVAFHNGLGYDIFVLFFVLGLEFNVGPDSIEGIPVQFVDTFYMSMFLNPDREKNSIEYWGNQLGFPKIDFRGNLQEIGFLSKDAPEGSEFLQYHELMDTYCERDTLVGKLTFKALVDEWNSIYKDNWDSSKQPEFYRAGQKAFYLMSCQELTGWKFDKEFALSLRERIQGMMEELRSEVEPLLPPRRLKKAEEKEYTMPAKPFKQNGEISATMIKWIEKHNAEYLCDTSEVIAYGKKYPIISGSMLDVKLPMSISNQDNMKEWFIEMGWKPTLWNFKKDSFGKPMRDPITRKLIQTTPKIQEAGKLCPNLEAMEGDMIKKVVKWLSLRNRLAVLEGWISNPRLDYDGRIGAGRTGIAATHRQKHKTVVNVPKADPKVLLGHEFRSLWISEDGMYIAAGDAAALEGRVMGSYTCKYDNGETARELLAGDVHSKNANAFYGKIYDEVSKIYNSPDFDKENPKWKPYRNKSKNGFYAILYGAAGPKVASTLGIPEKFGQEALDSFWEANIGTSKLKEKLEGYWETTGKKKYLPAIDGRILLTRKKSALLNTIFQSCGGIVMDYAGLFMDKKLGGIRFDNLRRPYYLYKGKIVRRIGYFHDEYEYECEGREIAEEVAKMIEDCIAQAGRYLKLDVELAGEGKVGINWKETH